MVTIRFVWEWRSMSGQQVSLKRFVTVSEMAEVCQLSRSRFYDLLEVGVFPKPVRHPSSKRPMYDLELQRKCLEIRQTGIGLSGQPVLFNRKVKRIDQAKLHRRVVQEHKRDHPELLDALKGLGLSPTDHAVAAAVNALFPSGYAGLDQGDVVRKVFLHLQAGKK
jgi:hypothetical protein